MPGFRMPGRRGTAARSVTSGAARGEPGGGQDPPDGSRADAVPEAEELALDAPVPPPRVLPGQAPDEFADLLRDQRASCGVRVGPLVHDDLPVPGEQGAGCHDPVQPKACGQQPRQGSDQGGSAQSGFGPLT